MESEGCLKALKGALKKLPEQVNVIHHSDRGIQYCSKAYTRLLRNRKLSISMTELNHCYESPIAERVNGILKEEYGLGHVFNAKEDIHKAINDAVKLYNTQRPHLS